MGRNEEVPVPAPGHRRGEMLKMRVAEDALDVGRRSS
jgi:hypothetical protein